MRMRRVTQPHSFIMVWRSRAYIPVIAIFASLGCSPGSEFSPPTAAEQQVTFENLQATTPVSQPVIADAMQRIVGIVVGVDPQTVRNDGTALILTSALDQAPTVGLGAAVKNGGYVLTAYHVVDENVRPIAIAGRGRQQAFRTSAEIFWCYQKGDLALLQLDASLPAGLSVIGSVAVGEPVWTHGRRALLGGFIIESPSTATGQTRLLSASFRLAHGDSGGPMLNLNGDLVAVNVGADTRKRRWWQSLRAAPTEHPVSLSIMLSESLLDSILSHEAPVGQYGDTC